MRMRVADTKIVLCKRYAILNSWKYLWNFVSEYLLNSSVITNIEWTNDNFIYTRLKISV